MDTTAQSIPSPDSPLGAPPAKKEGAPPKQSAIRIRQHPGPGLQHPHQPSKRY